MPNKEAVEARLGGERMAPVAAVHARKPWVMPISAAYKDFLKDLLAGFGPVRWRLCRLGDVRHPRGRHSLPQGRRSFASSFAGERKSPFTYRPKGRNPVAMSYWEVPERLLDDPEELVAWTRRAHAVAARY
jgi:DNA transformation protein and related proteins